MPHDTLTTDPQNSLIKAQPDNSVNGLPLHVVTLVSIGLHPTSGRERRADQDARAVELGLRLTQAASHSLSVVHAGCSQAPALRQYAGMGLGSVTVLEQTSDDDPLFPLSHHLGMAKADLILTGIRAESGDSSGMLPYLLANRLGIPLINGIADIISLENGQAVCLQALPRGQRRKVLIDLPCIATVDMAAPSPRQSAFGPSLRTHLSAITNEMPNSQDAVRLTWEMSPAKPRPKRMKTVKAKTAAERFKAATAKPDQQGGQIIVDRTPDEMAQILIEFLQEEKAISRPS